MRLDRKVKRTREKEDNKQQTFLGNQCIFSEEVARFKLSIFHLRNKYLLIIKHCLVTFLSLNLSFQIMGNKTESTNKKVLL